MCRAKEYSEQLQNIFQLIRKDIEQTNIKESMIDKEQSDLLHCIEFGTFNACEGYKICNMLKKIRIERRKNKRERDTLKSLYDGFTKQVYQKLINNSEQIIALENKQKILTYTPKVLKTISVKELCK